MQEQELWTELVREAQESGATTAAIVDASSLKFHEEFRKACEQNVCRRYGTTWSGPPAVGPISELRKRVEGFKHGLLIQNICPIEDSFDLEGMIEAGKVHEKRFRKILNHIKAKYQFSRLLPLNAGCCNLCERCSYLEGEPCRNPEEAVSSVECYGIDVTALKRSAGWPIYGGKNTVTYIAVIFFSL